MPQVQKIAKSRSGVLNSCNVDSCRRVAYSAYACTYANMGIFRYYWVTLFPYLTPNFHIISSENQFERTLSLRMPQNKTLQNCFCFVERGVVE
jgi:hypothetical protein